MTQKPKTKKNKNMDIQTAIGKARKGGWDKSLSFDGYKAEDRWIFLDPEFWQCFGEDMGWKDKVCRKCGMDLEWEKLEAGGKNYCDYCRAPSGDSTHCGEWRYKWHKFIDHLAEGGTIETFFEKLN